MRFRLFIRYYSKGHVRLAMETSNLTNMNKLLTLTLGLATVMPLAAKDRMTHDPKATNSETILHAWSWNFPTIGKNMKKLPTQDSRWCRRLRCRIATLPREAEN